jgi:hypothetical protein
VSYGYVEWYAPNEEQPLTFKGGVDSRFRLQEIDGLGPVDVKDVSVKSPGQAGVTRVDSSVPPRVVTLTGLVQGVADDEEVSSKHYVPADRHELLWAARAELSRHLVAAPIRRGATLEMGRLRVYRAGVLPPLEVDALPQSVSLPSPKGVVDTVPFDVEFFAPSPYWREAADAQLLFQQAGGEEFPLQFSIDIASNNIQQEVSNLGDVDAPIIARMYGDVTDARIMNLTTGETLEVTGNIPATHYVEVSTGFGDKRIELVTIADGTRASNMDRLNLALDDFWALRPGVNLVKFEASVNTSGRAELLWRQRYSGI